MPDKAGRCFSGFRACLPWSAEVLPGHGPGQDGPDGDHLDPADPMKLAGTVGTGGVDPFYPAFFQPVFQLFPVCRIFFRKQEKRGLAAAAGCQPDLWLRPSKDLQRFFQYGWIQVQKGTAGPEKRPAFLEPTSWAKRRRWPDEGPSPEYQSYSWAFPAFFAWRSL